jgi:succinate dehydrogenase / fumarate reductase cytochrome b subunit
MKLAYFPGCVTEDSCKELDHSTIKVARALGIDLVKLEDATCCGASYLQQSDMDLSLALNGRTLSMAEKMGANMMTVCATCQLYLSKAKRELDSPEKREKANKALAKVGAKYNGNVDIKHFLQILYENPQLLKSKVKKKLNLKVAPFYGCHTLRPQEFNSYDDDEDPKSLETIIGMLGGQPVNYEGKTKCCGFHLLTIKEDITLKMLGTHLLEAKKNGADVVVTPCPLCHLILDAYQKKAEKLLNQKIQLPILHLSQLVGLSLGLSQKDLELKRHMVSVTGVINKLT